jgi:uncharacterized delta-60 repeat protein
VWLDPDFGEPDTDFGTRGRVLLPSLPAPPGIGQLPDTAFTSIALQADGKIVVAGTQDGQLLLARFTPSGQFDRANFGTGGYVTTRLPLGGAVVGRVLVQPDG